MARSKEESLRIPMEETLYNFIDREKEQMQKELGRHISKAEVARRMLNVFMYLDMSPQADLGKIVTHASQFEDFVQEQVED